MIKLRLLAAAAFTLAATLVPTVGSAQDAATEIAPAGGLDGRTA